MATMADAPQPVLDDIAERVKAKEGARMMGVDLLQRLKQLLHDDPVGRGQEGLEDWNSNLASLETNIKSREILVGVVGETGLGKSSLINALLGCQIVPTSNSEACTAAVCIFGWNDDISDKNKTYRANITFKSYETVEAELDSLKVELADLEDTRKVQENNLEPEYNDRCAQVNRQVKNVASWSRLTQDLVRTSSPEQIIHRSPVFSNIFKKGSVDKTEKTFKTVNAASRQSFLDLLKPYVASSTGKLSGTQYWPLVEQVEIFLQSDILRYGIKLVDLPGTMDALESRAQIAREYFDRLEKRIVVTPATRAADNRAAAELILSEQDTMILDMNDMLRPDSLCVAITKIDDIDCDSAEHEFPTDDIRKICRELKDREELDEDDSDDDDDTDGNDDACQAGEKRPRAEGTLTRSVRLKVESGEPGKGNDYSSMDTEALRSLLKRFCINERNAELEQKVRDNLLATRKKNRKSRSTTDTLTKVFSISSKAFQSFKRSSNRGGLEGFPDRESTGIPGLRSWLEQVSLDYREEWVDGDIQHMQVLFDAADGWNQVDHLLDLKLTGDEKKKVQDGVTRQSSNFKALINNRVRGNIQRNLSAMKPLRNIALTRTSVARKTGKEEPNLARAVILLGQAVEGWEKKNPRAKVAAVSRHDKTHWATYRACVRRNGSPFNRPARNGQAKSTVHWMDDVSHAFWQGHFENWAYEFTRRIPLMKGKIRGTALKVFNTWLKKILEDEGLPQSYRDLLKANAFKLTHLFERYITKVRQRVTKFQVDSRAKRGPLQEAMANCLRPGFEAAIQHKGDGFMVKQMKAIRTYASNIGHNMFEAVRNDLEKELADDIKKLSADIAKYWAAADKKGCGDLINAEMNRLSKSLCKKKGKPTTSARISNETDNQLSDAINSWRLEWHRVFVRLPVNTHPLEEFEEAEEAVRAPLKAEVEEAEAEEDQQPLSVKVKTEALENDDC